MNVRLFLLIGLGFLTVACSGSTPKPQGEARSPKAGGETRMLFPRIMHEMPASGVLDLGPVIVLRDVSGLDTMTVLQEAAERLGADAFVLEHSTVSAAYPVQTQQVGSFLETFDGTTYQVSTFVYRGSAGAHGGTGTSEKNFYRAIRFVDGDPATCQLDTERLGPDIAILFEGVKSLKEQLRILSVLASRGVISGKTLREVRKHCLDQVPRKKPKENDGS
ncbi:MAG TPA: hypothetical protein VM425_19260 [Myxococcota bacterium]|nr:hypothetical protein [Myxococcota bacterium]